jgi:hypothetical protein
LHSFPFDSTSQLKSLHPGTGIRIVESFQKESNERINEEINSKTLVNSNLPFTDLTKPSVHIQSLTSEDNRLKRNPTLYTFQPQETEEKKTSWTINVGFIEDNKDTGKISTWKDEAAIQAGQGSFKVYGFDQGNTVLNLFFSAKEIFP